MSKSEGQEKIDKISSKAVNVMIFIICGCLFGVACLFMLGMDDLYLFLGLVWLDGGTIVLGIMFISLLPIPYYISLYKKTQVLLSEQLKEDKEKVKDTLDKF